MRPPLPPSSFISGPLINTIHSSWDFHPSNRPSFEQIARDIKKMRSERLNTFPTGDSPKPPPLLDQWGTHNPYRPHHSPDILPLPLLDGGSPATPLVNNFHDAEGSASHPGSGLGLDIGASVTNAPVEENTADSPATRHTRSSSISSDTLTSSASIVHASVLSGYVAPLDDIAAKYQDERRYRMLLQHDYHTICTSLIPFMACLCHKLSRSDTPAVAAISHRTRRRGLFIQT